MGVLGTADSCEGRTLHRGVWGKRCPHSLPYGPVSILATFLVAQPS